MGVIGRGLLQHELVYFLIYLIMSLLGVVCLA